MTEPRYRQAAAVPGVAGRPRPSYPVIVAGSLALAALSLLVLPRGVAYDPLSWLVWGRQLLHGRLDTQAAATSVKPLPILVNTVLAGFGHLAPDLWLLLARAGAIAGVALGFRVADRLAGPWAGAAAALGVAASSQYASYLFFTGMSEPLTTATLLWAVDEAISRRHRRAFAAFLVTGLLRLEAWPLAFGYAAWRVWREPAPRRLATEGAGLICLPVAWFGLDWIGSGSPLRSASAASRESQGGPLTTAHPGLAVLAESIHLLLAPLAVLAVLTWVVALWRRPRAEPLSVRACWTGPVVWMGAATLAWLAVVAAMAAARAATGAPRYLLPAAGVATVIGAVGLSRAVAWVAGPGSRGAGRARWVAAAAAVAVVGLSAPQLVTVGDRVDGEVAADRRLADISRLMGTAVRLAGGGAAIARCGHAATDRFQVPALVWAADLRFREVDGTPAPTGTVIEVDGSPPLPAGTAYRRLGTLAAGATRLTVYTSCG